VTLARTCSAREIWLLLSEALEEHCTGEVGGVSARRAGAALQGLLPALEVGT
jgi:hypothetical protein